MKPKKQNRTCPDGLSNECVVWQSGDIPCLGICNGDELSVAEKIIADKICELFGDIDMSGIDMNCLLETCAQKCKDTSLKAVIQVLFDNQCCLTDLINNVSGGSINVSVNLNLRCLKRFDDFGNEIPQDLNQTLQSIINQVCTNVTSISSLQVQVNNLQTQVDNIPTGGSTSVEPQVTTCLTPGLRPVSQVVPLVAQAFCDFQTAVGTVSDMSQALSLQCPNLNSAYQATNNWLITVNNLAQSMNNLWIVTCDVLNRITAIENNCCKVTCDDIKLGFDVVLNSSATGITLKFTSKAGTSIPAAFTDCGSSVNILDKDGVYIDYPLVITNNAMEGDFDITGLDTNDPVTITVTANMCTEGLTCQKCITKVVKLDANACPVCQVTAAGTTGTATITYSIP